MEGLIGNAGAQAFCQKVICALFIEIAQRCLAHCRLLMIQLPSPHCMADNNRTIVPTGLEVSGSAVYMAEAGSIPHLPQNGKVVSFGKRSITATLRVRPAAGRIRQAGAEVCRRAVRKSLPLRTISCGVHGSSWRSRAIM